MGRTVCTEPQYLYNGALYLYLTVELYLYSPYGPYGLYRASVPVQGCTLPFHFFIRSDFSSIPIVVDRFFTWISLGDVNSFFSPTLVRKVNVLQKETRPVPCLLHQYTSNQSIHVADGVTMKSLCASLQHKTRATTGLVCHIAITENYRVSSKRGVNFESRVETKSPKKKSR